MGPIITKQEEPTPKKKFLTNSEILEFRNISSFSEQIVVKLHSHYSLFCAVHSDDGVIDYSEFCFLINKEDNSLSRRIFKAIDTNNDQVINFFEFIKFFGCFCSGTMEEKVLLSFKIFSDDSKTIKTDTMYHIIYDIVKSEWKLKNYFDKDSISLIVANTFKNIFPINSEVSKEDQLKGGSVKNKEQTEEFNNNQQTINFQQYKDIIAINPTILQWLKLDLERLKNAKINNTKVKKSNCCY